MRITIINEDGAVGVNKDFPSVRLALAMALLLVREEARAAVLQCGVLQVGEGQHLALAGVLPLHDRALVLAHAQHLRARQLALPPVQHDAAPAVVVDALAAVVVVMFVCHRVHVTARFDFIKDIRRSSVLLNREHAAHARAIEHDEALSQIARRAVAMVRVGRREGHAQLRGAAEEARLVAEARHVRPHDHPASAHDEHPGEGAAHALDVVATGVRGQRGCG